MAKPFDKCIDLIEDAIFGDREECGCRDTENGDMILTEIGRDRLRKLLRQFKLEDKCQAK